MRHDALVAAAGMILAVRRVACAHAPLAVGTVGLVENQPNSSNVVPGEVFFTIDIRHPEDTVVAEMEATLMAELEALAEENGVALAVERIWDAPAVHFDPGCIDMVAQAARQLGYTAREMVSGPGHDAGYVAKVAPTAMIFVPCKDGLSHNEEESILEEDAQKGANVLLSALLAADGHFSRGS
jgi:N-carbamoyl-L-amino-acid hydrolase